MPYRKSSIGALDTKNVARIGVNSIQVKANKKHGPLSDSLSVFIQFHSEMSNFLKIASEFVS
jgi:hypothetical protein